MSPIVELKRDKDKILLPIGLKLATVDAEMDEILDTRMVTLEFFFKMISLFSENLGLHMMNRTIIFVDICKITKNIVNIHYSKTNKTILIHLNKDGLKLQSQQYKKKTLLYPSLQNKSSRSFSYNELKSLVDKHLG